MLVLKGNRGLVFGDRHVDDLYKGRHKNYLANSQWCMSKTLEIVSERKPDVYFETGDLIGQRNGVSYLEDRGLLYEMVDFFKSLGVPAIVNKGNHDIHGGLRKNDYQFLSRLGCYHTPDTIEDGNGRIIKFETDFDGYDIYVHLVPYGDEYRQLKPVKDALNIAITHNDFRIGSETFTNNKDAIDLVTHNAFFGMDFIINGHIHIPSDRVKLFKFANGDEAQFINLGCMARPKITENYLKCWCLEFGVRAGKYGGEPEFYYQNHIIDLLPLEEVFDLSTKLTQLVEEEVELENNTEELKNLMTELQGFSWGGNSFEERVSSLPIDDKIKKLILEYVGG